jgi:hypothetical protein
VSTRGNADDNSSSIVGAWICAGEPAMCTGVEQDLSRR